MFRGADIDGGTGYQPSHADILHEIRGMRSDIADLTAIVEPIRDDVADIKEMAGVWQTVKNLSRFAKWIGGLATAVTAVFLLLKSGHAGR